MSSSQLATGFFSYTVPYMLIKFCIQSCAYLTKRKVVTLGGQNVILESYFIVFWKQWSMEGLKR